MICCACAWVGAKTNQTEEASNKFHPLRGHRPAADAPDVLELRVLGSHQPASYHSIRNMRLRVRFIVLAAAFLVGGCSSTRTMMCDHGAPPKLFPITYDQADRIIAAAMTSSFAGD